MLVRHMKIAKSQKQEIEFPNAQDEARGIKKPIGTVFFSSNVVAQSGHVLTLLGEAFRQFFLIILWKGGYLLKPGTRYIDRYYVCTLELKKQSQ